MAEHSFRESKVSLSVECRGLFANVPSQFEGNHRFLAALDARCFPKAMDPVGSGLDFDRLFGHDPPSGLAGLVDVDQISYEISVLTWGWVTATTAVVRGMVSGGSVASRTSSAGGWVSGRRRF